MCLMHLICSKSATTIRKKRIHTCYWNGKLAGSRTTRRWRTQVKGWGCSWCAWAQQQEQSVPSESGAIGWTTTKEMWCCNTTRSREDGKCWSSINYQQPIKAAGGSWTGKDKGQRRDEQEVCKLGGQTWAFAGYKLTKLTDLLCYFLLEPNLCSCSPSFAVLKSVLCALLV